MNRQQDNLANQRKAALVLLKNQGGVERVEFTQEGAKVGLGAPWMASAVVTIDGRLYNEVLGPRALGGDPMPDLPPSREVTPVEVIYSDGSSEVIR